MSTPEPRAAARAPRLVARARMTAPKDLTDAQRKQWRSIVNSLPADYFRPSDVSLLRAYCIASAMLADAADEIGRDGITIDNGHGRRVPHAAVHVMSAATAAMAQMAVKLRLCPSSRYDDRTAATKANASKDAKRPWEN